MVERNMQKSKVKVIDNFLPVFEFNFKVENIKIIPGAYDVIISSKLLSEFTNKQYNLKYFIALEPDSTFG